MNKISLIVAFTFICFCLQTNFSQTINQPTEKVSNEETGKLKNSIKTPDAVNEKKKIVFVGGTLNREFYGLPVFVTDDAKLTDTEIKEIDGVKVTVRTYTYEKIKRLYDEVETCDIERDALSAAYNEYDYGFDDYITYSINDKVFGYYLNYWIFQPEDKYEIGAGFLNIYLQKEENGFFKVSCEDERGLKSIPQWVKEISKK